MLLGQLLSPRNISGPSGMNCSLMLGNSQVRVYMHCLCASVTSLSSVYSPTPKCRKCLKSWPCNMQCNSMRPEIGSANRTSQSSSTSPCYPSANCPNLVWAVPKGQRAGTSWPFIHHHSDLISLFCPQQCPSNWSPLQQMWLFPPTK